MGAFTVGFGFKYVVSNVAFTIDASFADAGNFNPPYFFNIGFKLITKVIPIDDRSNAEDHYKKGIKAYVGDDIDGAHKEFKTIKGYNPHYNNIDKKICDWEEIQKLKK